MVRSDALPSATAAPTILGATIVLDSDPVPETAGCSRRFDVTVGVGGAVAAVMLFYRDAGSGESGQVVMTGADGSWRASVELPTGDYDVMIAATGPAGTASGGAQRVVASCDGGDELIDGADEQPVPGADG